MLNKAKAISAKIKSFGLIRDKNGKPKIDDYKNCPDEIKKMLTQAEKEEFEKCH